MLNVFVAHPMSGDVEGNWKAVDAICRVIHTTEILPIFPSSTWRRYLDLSDPKTAELAHAVNTEYFRRKMVDEVWFYGNRMSDGMKAEAALAHSFGIKLVGQSPQTKAALVELRYPQ